MHFNQLENHADKSTYGSELARTKSTVPQFSAPKKLCHYLFNFLKVISFVVTSKNSKSSTHYLVVLLLLFAVVIRYLHWPHVEVYLALQLYQIDWKDGLD